MILEPTTTLTDYILGGLALVLGRRLWLTGQRTQQVTIRLWAASFLVTGIAALAGGTSHGFADVLGPAGHAVLWKLTMWSIGGTAFLLLCATAHAALQGRFRRVLIVVAAVQLVVYVAWTLRHDEFIWVIADYLPAVAVVLVLQLRELHHGRPGAGWLVLGIVTTLVGAGVQASGFALHANFNHNDLYHVVQMGATVMLYRGASVARDRSVAT
jgi:uncharacterized membrane protein